MKRPTENEIRDLWLQKYHNTNTAEIILKYPKELLESPKWFEMFPCTQQQSDEWTKEVKNLLKKKYKFSKWLIEMGWWQIELNCRPNIKHPLENISSVNYGDDGIGLNDEQITNLL